MSIDYNHYQSVMKLKSLKEIANPQTTQKIFTDYDQSPTPKFKKRKQTLYQRQHCLQSVVKQIRINNIVKLFVYKLKRNVSRNNQLDYSYNSQIQDKITHKQQQYKYIPSFQVNQHLKAILISLDIICILVIQTLSTFHGFYEDYIERDAGDLSISLIQIFCLSVFFLKIVMGFTTPRLSHGINNQYMRYVAKQYATSIIFVFNLFNFVMTIFKMIFPLSKAVGIVSFIISVLSMPVLTQDLQIVQATWINSLNKRQYFAMFKVLLFNLFFVQFISTLLVAVTYYDLENNWITKAIANGHMMQDLVWWQQYFYALYWAIVTMATIGFGDLTPANYLQTAVLCLLMLLGTTTLSYNITSIGAIVQNLRRIDQQRRSQTIIFKRMCNDEKISSQLQNKILDYIYKAAQFRSQFDFIERKKFLQNLPAQLRNDLQYQYADNIFSKIPFFRSLSRETLIKLSVKLNGQIYYPGEDMIIVDGKLTKIMLLKHGKIGFTYDKPKSKLNGLILQSRQINKDIQNPYLLNKYLLSRTKKFNYRIVAETYCMFLQLEQDDFCQIIRQNKKDKELYFYMYNSRSTIDQQWDIFQCSQCAPKKHTVFLCPKLHYMPYKSLAIERYLYSPAKPQKANRQYRRRQNRIKRKPCLSYWKGFYSEYEKRWEINSSKAINKKNKQVMKAVGKKQMQIESQKNDLNNLLCGVDNYSHQVTQHKQQPNQLIIQLSDLILKRHCAQHKDKKQEKQHQLLDIDMIYNYTKFFPKFNPQHFLMKGFSIKKKPINKIQDKVKQI